MKHKFFALMAVAALALSACSTDEAVETPQQPVTENQDPAPETPESILLTPKPFDFWSLYPDERKIIANVNQFGNRLASYIYAYSPNFICSPLSIEIALMMTANGASDTGWAEVAQALNLDAVSLDELNSCYGKIMKGLTSGYDEGLQFSVANSVWVREGLPIEPLFMENMQKVFNAESFNISTKEAMDDWASKKTNGLIDKMPLGGSLDELQLLLANATYFNGQWQNKFDAEKTIPYTFHNYDGTTTETKFMNNKSGLMSAWEEGYSMITLPYKINSFQMVFFLPDEGYELADMLPTIDWFTPMENHEVYYAIPLFKETSEFSATEFLKELGVNDLFHQTPGIAPGITLSDVSQTATIEVNESGAKAAAISTSDWISSPTIPSLFLLDRPFAYAIVEQNTQTVLFQGVVSKF